LGHFGPRNRKPRVFKRFSPVRLVLAGSTGTVIASLERPTLLDRWRATKPLATYA